jgi:hypothetical protein
VMSVIMQDLKEIVKAALQPTSKRKANAQI